MRSCVNERIAIKVKGLDALGCTILVILGYRVCLLMSRQLTCEQAEKKLRLKRKEVVSQVVIKKRGGKRKSYV